MKCLIIIFTICVIQRYINGQSIMEGRNDKSESGDLEGLEDAVFRGETEENSSGDKKPNTQDDVTLEANTDPDPGLEGKIVTLSVAPKDNDEKTKQIFRDTMKRFASEMAAGEPSDIVGQNQHIEQDQMFNDLGRRFVPQYKYTGAFKNIPAEHDEDNLTPEKAPPELVLLVAKESALLGPDKDTDLGNEVDRKKILRSGDYWNGVWKEEVDVKTALRSSNTEKKVLGSIKAKVKPGSEFYKVVSRMKKISPRLLYIINKKQL